MDPKTRNVRKLYATAIGGVVVRLIDGIPTKLATFNELSPEYMDQLMEDHRRTADDPSLDRLVKY